MDEDLTYYTIQRQQVDKSSNFGRKGKTREAEVKMDGRLKLNWKGAAFSEKAFEASHILFSKLIYENLNKHMVFLSCIFLINLIIEFRIDTSNTYCPTVKQTLLAEEFLIISLIDIN